MSMYLKILVAFLFLSSPLYLFSEEEEEGPEGERRYFEFWNYPRGAELNPDFLNTTWQQILSVPSENELDVTTNTWRLIGPYGSVHVNSGARFSGRVLDIEVGNAVNPVIASASGGLWSYFGFIPFSISDNINSLVCGSFCTKPGDANTILLGTGEHFVRSGTGLYRSTNSGASWTKIDLSSEPSAFYKMRFINNSTINVGAATSAGYFRSTNTGLNWTKTLNGVVTDFAVNPSNSQIIFAGVRNDGIYKSTNNGLNWVKIVAPGMPTTNIGRIALSIGTTITSRIAACIVRLDDDHTHGVYLSIDDGATWTNKPPPENIHGNQGWYDNVVSISPTNANIVFAGGVHMWKTTNFGYSWTEITDDNVHADQHVIEWNENGSTMYLGNDGGIAVSSDQGNTFSTQINFLPITQYKNFDIGLSNRGVMYGGSQDNGITGTTNGGQSWIFTMGGDGGGVAIDPFSALYIYMTRGYLLGDWAFKRYKSTDKGLTWTETNTGIDPSDQWYTKMRSDRNTPLTLYHNSGWFVYKSVDNAGSWSKVNNISFPAEVSNLNVSKYSASGTVIYASLNSTSSGQRLRVYDGGTFYERSTGFPSGQYVRGVATHITNTSIAYALMNGYSAGQKIYKTTNKGVNWVNISGDLPDVPMGDLVAHPTNNNYLYLGTEMGCYKTTNGGINWMRWNNGMSNATIVTEMKWIDSTTENGRFYVAACTYGRSIWVRDVSGDDPVGLVHNTGNVPSSFELSQNYPNPFNPTTNIKFAIPKGSDVRITIFDVNGKEVETLINGKLEAGYYTVDWNAGKNSSGVYFYRIETNGFVDSKKMILVK